VRSSRMHARRSPAFPDFDFLRGLTRHGAGCGRSIKSVLPSPVLLKSLVTM
jgi:hypothetical protein